LVDDIVDKAMTALVLLFFVSLFVVVVHYQFVPKKCDKDCQSERTVEDPVVVVAPDECASSRTNYFSMSPPRNRYNLVRNKSRDDRSDSADKFSQTPPMRLCLRDLNKSPSSDEDGQKWTSTSVKRR